MDCMGGSETYLLSRLISHQSNLTWRLWKRALLRLFLLAVWEESRMIKHTNTLVAGVLKGIDWIDVR